MRVNKREIKKYSLTQYAWHHLNIFLAFFFDKKNDKNIQYNAGVSCVHVCMLFINIEQFLFRLRRRFYCCCVELPFHVLFSSSESFVSLKRWIFEPVPPARLYGPLFGCAPSPPAPASVDWFCCLSNRRIRFLALKLNKRKFNQFDDLLIFF